MPWYFSCKSHWFCGLVQIHPQDVVVFILNTATESGWLSPWDPPLQWGKVHERIYRPATHPIHFAAVSPDKIHRYAAWAVFFFYGKRTLKISWAVRTWYRLSSQRRCTNRGRNFVRVNRRLCIRAVTLYLFLRLNNSETTLRNVFWAQR